MTHRNCHFMYIIWQMQYYITRELCIHVLHSSPVCIDTSQIIFHIHPLVSGRKAYATCVVI